MVSSFIQTGDTAVHYLRAGDGPDLLVCFHGFGEHARTFELLSGKLPGFTIIAFDLPFHGKTTLDTAAIFSVKELLDIIKRCPEIQEKKFGLLGYSMGGRIALSVYEAAPFKVECIILLAPDGLVVNPWYRFATRTIAGKKIFRYTMLHPGWFLGLLNFSKRLNLVNQSVWKFVQSQVGDLEVRKKIYAVWMAFRQFSPDLKTIRRQILEHQSPVYMLFGQYDRIITPNKGIAFVKSIQPYGKIKIIESGHQLLHPRNLNAITEAITTCYREKTALR
jgi:pimeloyl-ACP methyl ester carboxylesterase